MMSEANGLSAIPAIKTNIGTPSWRARRSAARFVNRTVSSTLLMSAAFGGAVLVASWMRSGSAWTGLNAVAVATGLGPRRAKSRFDATATLRGAGVLGAGLLLFAGLYQGARLLRK